MKASVFFLCLLFFCGHTTSSVLAATGDDGKTCGVYDISGSVVFYEGRLAVKVFEGSRSEIILTVPDSFQMKIAPYLNRAVRIEGVMRRPVDRYRGEIEITKIKERVPNPLGKNGGSELRKVKTCSAS